jgi:hypothetical protein
MLNTHQSDQKMSQSHPSSAHLRSVPFVRITRAPEISCVLVALVASAFSDSRGPRRCPKPRLLFGAPGAGAGPLDRQKLWISHGYPMDKWDLTIKQW